MAGIKVSALPSVATLAGGALLYAVIDTSPTGSRHILWSDVVAQARIDLGIDSKVDGRGNGAATRIAFWTDANTIDSDPGITWVSNTLTVDDALVVDGDSASPRLPVQVNIDSVPMVYVDQVGILHTTERADFGSVEVGPASNGDTSTTCLGNGANGRSQDVAIGQFTMNAAIGIGTRDNVGVGYQVMRLANGIVQNTAVGSQSLYSLTSGSDNAAFGYAAGLSISTGTGNVCIGAHAGRFAVASDEFYLDDRNRTSNASEKTRALAYGSFATLPTNQTLRLNARLRVNLSDNSTTQDGSGVPSNQSIVAYAVSQVNSGCTLMLDAFTGAGRGSEFAGRSSRGNAASPTATQLGDSLARFTAYGRGASAFSTAYRAGIVMEAAEAWTATAQGAYIDLHTTTPGTTTTAARLRVWGDGGVQIGGAYTTSPGAAALSVTGEVFFGAAQHGAVITVSGNTTLNATHATVLVDASGGPVTITLPLASGANGRLYDIKKVDASANGVTITRSGADTIDGGISLPVLAVQYQSRTVKAQASSNSWWAI